MKATIKLVLTLIVFPLAWLWLLLPKWGRLADQPHDALLDTYIDLAKLSGTPDSPACKRFLAAHEDNEEFQFLANAFNTICSSLKAKRT